MFSDEMMGVLNYIRLQKATFERMQTALPSDFNNGLLSGLDLVKSWIEMTCKGEKACDTTAERKEKE